MSPMVEIRCSKCRRLLARMDDKMAFLLEQDTSHLRDENWPMSAGQYPQFRCPKHGRRAPFDRIGYHAEMLRSEAPDTALV
jgi:hypothetical protein